MSDGCDVDAAQATAAAHGQWCPKMCSHSCPVLRATGRADAVPWSFHRTVADLDEGRLPAADAAGRLVACTGCRACAGACAVAGQDVPAQVVAARAAVRSAAPGAMPAADAAVEAVQQRRSPYGVERPGRVGATRIDVVLVAGCRDEPATVASAVRLLAAAGQVAEVVVPAGCCGAALRELGAIAEADAAASELMQQLDVEAPVLLLDPHCVEEVRTPGRVVHLTEHLHELVEQGRLRPDVRSRPVRWHEPCRLRGTEAAGRGAALLAAAGLLVELPGEVHHGCSGGGLGLPLLAEEAAAAVAQDRLQRFTGTGPLVTSCSGALASLRVHEPDAVHLADALASLLDDLPETVA